MTIQWCMRKVKHMRKGMKWLHDIKSELLVLGQFGVHTNAMTNTIM